MRYSKVDHGRLARLLLPTFLRKKGQLGWLLSLIAPLGSLCKDILYKMQHDGRAIYLEKLLNEACGAAHYDTDRHGETKQVCVRDAYVPKAHHLHIQKEERQLFAPLHLYAPEELEDTSIRYADFEVVVPEAHLESLDTIKNLLDFYKLAGKVYRLVRPIDGKAGPYVHVRAVGSPLHAPFYFYLKDEKLTYKILY